MVLDFLNSANVIVQNRMTGQLEEEKMQVYVRLAIRLLYKGFLSEMESESGMRTYHPLILLSYFFVLSSSSSSSPQGAFIQAGYEIRRPGVSQRDPELHQVPPPQR